MQGKQSQINRV